MFRKSDEIILNFMEKLAERLKDMAEILLDIDERITKLEGKDEK